MYSFERLLYLSNKRKVSDKQFVHLFQQLNHETPITRGQFEELLQDASNESYLIVISLSNNKTNAGEFFWDCMKSLPINQQIRLLKKYQLKFHLIESVELFVPKFIDYCESALAIKNDHLINTIILNWNILVNNHFDSIKELDIFKKFFTKLLNFLHTNHYSRQLEYCHDKFKNSSSGTANAKASGSKFSLKLNNVNVNVNSKNYSNFENFKIFYLFNNYYFKNFNIPDNETIFQKFNKDFNGDCYKLIYSIFLGINLSVSTNQVHYIQNNWLLFLNSRLPKIILLYRTDNLEEIITKIFSNFPNVNLNLKQNFIKSLIFNKILSIKSFHKFFPNEIKINQQNLIHEMSNINSVDSSFEEILNDKLYNINCEFISLEESNLIDIFHKILNKIEFSMIKQIELANAIEKLLNVLIDDLDFEKLNRLVLVILHNNKLFNLLLFNLRSKSVLFKLIRLVDNSESFKVGDDDNSFQDLYSYFGNVLLFIIKLSNYLNFNFKLKSSFTFNYLNNFRFNYSNLTSNYSTGTKENSSFSSNLSSGNDSSDSSNDNKIIVENYETLINEWIRSLFDDDTDGLSDDLIKSIDVKQIYQLIPIIFQQAIMAFIEGKINLKILVNGLDYLCQNFLLPCNLSIINWLSLKISLKNVNLNNYLKVLNEMIKLINNIKVESNNELKLTSEILLDLICQSLANANITQLNIALENNDVMNKISQICNPANFKDLNFADFEDNLVKGFNGLTDINYKFIDYYVNTNKALIKNLIIMLNNGSGSSSSNTATNHSGSSSENLKFLIDFIIYIVLLHSIKNNNIKNFWIGKFETLTIDDTVDYKVNQGFEISMDYHYSSIFNQDDQGEPDAGTAPDSSNNTTGTNDSELNGQGDDLFENCINETYKYSNDLIDFFYILVKFKGLTENESFLKSINLIHNKLLADLKHFNTE